MGTIEGYYLKLRDRVVIQTAQINIIAVWVRSGSIEGMNSAIATKMMFGSTCIEGIRTECILSLEQSKSRLWDDEMDESFFATDRAITLGCFEFFDLDSIANFTAMTAAMISYRSLHNFHSIEMLI